MRLVIPAPMETMTTCQNVGCGVEDTITGIVDHMTVCPLHIVECPCSGCYDRMPRIEVTSHVETSVWAHVRKAVFLEKTRAYELAEMQAKIDQLEQEKECASICECMRTSGSASLGMCNPSGLHALDLAESKAGCETLPKVRWCDKRLHCDKSC